MSTTYHTPIPTGADGNSSVVNSPLGELDAAIAAVTSAANSEVVTARSAGNVSTAAASLTERLAWLEGENIYPADAYGFAQANSASDNLTALTDAVNDARTNNGVVKLPAGIFNVNGFSFPGDDIMITGAGMPFLNAAGTALVGGTILKGGTMSLNDKRRLMLMNLGIDMSVAGGDAIQSGNNATTPQNVMLINVSALGNGASGTHGVSLTSGSHNLISNFNAYNFDHGAALRCSYTRVVNFLAQNCSASTLTLKAIDTVNCEYNTISNIIGDGTATYNQGAIIVEAHNGAVCQHNTISNGVVRNATFGLQIKSIDGGSGHGTNTRNNIENLILAVCQFDGVRIQGDSSKVSYISLDNVRCRQPGAYGFRNLLTTDLIDLQNCHTSFAGTDNYFGPFRVREINGRSERLAIVSRTAAQSIPVSAWTEITHTEAKSQTDDEFWDSSTNPEHLISPVTGRYKIVAQIDFDANATGIRGVRIKRSQDGAVVCTNMMDNVGATYDTTVTCEFIQNMNKDTYYTVEVFQASGGALDINNTYSVSMVLVR